MADLNQYNPFGRRETYGFTSITTYKVITIITWTLSTIASIYYSLVDGPRNGSRIFELNDRYQTAFTLDSTTTYFYWAVLFILQLGYIAYLLLSEDTDYLFTATSISGHFILNNLLHVGTIILFTRSYFYWTEFVLVLNFANLSSLYFRHGTYLLPRFLYAPVVSIPLAWNFVAIYWNGAIMIHRPHNLALRVLGNISIWAILTYGGFFIFVYKDYTMAFSLSILAASIGTAQFLMQSTLQWMFAFIIVEILFVSTFVVATLAWINLSAKSTHKLPQ